MDVKLFEIRDAATFIPVVAVKLSPRNEEELYLYRRAGYGLEQPYVILTRLDGTGHAFYDPFDWPNRTMHVAHLNILEHWDSLTSGQVIDVEFIIGERETPKISERLSAPI